MSETGYYHMYANGDDAKNFVLCERDILSAFNRVGVCAANCNAKVVSFSIEDTHPHILLYGSQEDCLVFKQKYESSTKHYIVSNRGSIDDVFFDCDLDFIDDNEHLKNVGTYTISQPTKDGKPVMPYDYLYGTGALYFRSSRVVLPWLVASDGSVSQPQRLASFCRKQQKAILSSRSEVPEDWLVCNGFLLPTNYVDISLFEKIYVTHNCFRAFLCSGKQRDQAVHERMAKVHGICMEDMEARRICSELCLRLFGMNGPRGLDARQRLKVAQNLRTQYYLPFRQVASIVRLPESEIRKYVR